MVYSVSLFNATAASLARKSLNSTNPILQLQSEPVPVGTYYSTEAAKTQSKRTNTHNNNFVPRFNSRSNLNGYDEIADKADKAKVKHEKSDGVDIYIYLDEDGNEILRKEVCGNCVCMIFTGENGYRTYLYDEDHDGKVDRMDQNNYDRVKAGKDKDVHYQQWHDDDDDGDFDRKSDCTDNKDIPLGRLWYDPRTWFKPIAD